MCDGNQLTGNAPVQTTFNMFEEMCAAKGESPKQMHQSKVTADENCAENLKICIKHESINKFVDFVSHFKCE